MKRLRFQRGSAYIEVKIEDRKIEFVTPLMNFVPIKIDLDKLEEQKEKIEKMNIDKGVLKELSLLQTEEEMESDLIKDLHKSGWRVQKIGGR